MRPIDRQISREEFALPTWPLSPSIQDHMVREEAKSLTPKQCAVVELALDTIKVTCRLHSAHCSGLRPGVCMLGPGDDTGEMMLRGRAKSLSFPTGKGNPSRSMGI